MDALIMFISEIIINCVNNLMNGDVFGCIQILFFLIF